MFTDNPSLVKQYQCIPGINYHAMVVTDSDVKLVYITNRSLEKVTCSPKQTGLRFILLVKNSQPNYWKWLVAISVLKTYGILLNQAFKSYGQFHTFKNVFKKELSAMVQQKFEENDQKESKNVQACKEIQTLD